MAILQVREQYQKEYPNEQNTMPAHYWDWLEKKVVELSTIKALDNLTSSSRVSHSMTGDGMNCIEFFDMIKKEWCKSEEQYKPFWNDVLTFAMMYHKERKH